MFWEIFESLCQQRGSTPTAISQEMGFSNATAAKWKKGSIPQGTTLQKIATYFDISVDYLLGKEEKKPPMPEGTEDMGENEKRLMAMWSQIPEEQKPELLTLIEAALRMRGEH